MLCLLVVMTAGCVPTFLISKDCKTYFFGEVNETKYKMLCPSGDFERVLNSTTLPRETKNALYWSTCRDRSRQRPQAVYASLSAAQKRDLKFSFQKQGCEVNVRLISNFRYEAFTTGPGFCVPE
jgi:hypothetical protein